MKILVCIVLSVVSTLALASDPYVQLQKDMAEKYLDIALYTADARENKQLYCDTGTSVPDVIDMTLKAISAARQARDSAFTSRILKSITSNVTLQKVVSSQVSYRYALATPTLGYTTDTSRAALIGSTMYGPAMGVLGNISEITFGAGGSAKLTTKEYDGDSDRIKFTTKYVTFVVSQNSNYQTVVTIDSVRYVMTQNSEGFVLVPESSENPDDSYQNGFVEFPSECDA